MATLSPLPKLYFTGADGLPLVGGKVYTYAAGTTTPQATYTDSSQVTPNANPVILDSRGEAGIWLDTALTYKFVLKDSSDVLIYTVDNISGAAGGGGGGGGVVGEWLTSVAGTNTITAAAASGAIVYSAGDTYRFEPANINTGAVTINVNGIGAKNILNQQGIALLPGQLQTNFVHQVTYDGTQFFLLNPAINPARVTVASDSINSAIWVASDEIDFTGTATITDFPDAPKAGEWKRLICAGACVFTNNANITVQGGATYTATAGDIVTVHALTTTTFRVDIQPSAVIIPAFAATTSSKGAVELATQAEMDQFAANVVPTGDVMKAILRNEQVFTANGTWTRPTGIDKVFVIVVGAGGSGGTGGSGSSANWGSGGGGGGGGGCSMGWVTVNGNVTVTVGTTAGATSSFAASGGTLSATGGASGSNGISTPSESSGGAGGAGGAGSGGTTNLQGSKGSGGGVSFTNPKSGGFGGKGGGSFLADGGSGGRASSATSSGTAAGEAGGAGANYGGGGGGGGGASSDGVSGTAAASSGGSFAQGVVIVRW